MDRSPSLSPLATFRSSGRVHWALLGRSRAVQTAHKALDATFSREVRIARSRIAAGWPRRLAADHAFEAIGVTMEKYTRLGALDTEPSANVRLALEQMIPARGAFTGPRPLPKPLREQLDRSVQTLKLSVRSANALKTARIQYLGELVQRSEADLLTIKNFGRTSLREIKQVLALPGFTLGMKLPGWTPPA